MPPKTPSGSTSRVVSATGAAEMATMETPQLTRRDPSIITPTTSAPNALPIKIDPNFHPVKENIIEEEIEESRCGKCKKFLYNKDDKTICERTCQSWLYIIGYSIMYLIFLSTYTMVFLYCSLEIIKLIHDPDEGTFSRSIGLSATPTSENDYPVIWYRNGESNDYDKYVSALNTLLSMNNRSKRAVNERLGPCGYAPYGYGDNPCIVIRINKQLKWTAKPLQIDSPQAKEAPEQVQKWLKMNEKKFWLHCSGLHSYDREHIGDIRYFPDPPGFESEDFPLSMNARSPLVAIQVSNFTIGISLAIECKLWYDSGVATLDFMLYVAPKRIILRNNTSLRL